MKLKNTYKLWVLAAAVACTATTSTALTLGKARGAVLLGQPLGLTVTIQTEPDEGSADLCFDAEVFYGDVRQESSRVSTAPLRSESGAPTAVRISTTTPIDEPVVTVYLRSGCGIKTSRKYVLLSDLVSDLLPTTAPEAVVRSPRPSARAPSVIEAPTVLTPSPAPGVSKMRKTTEPSALPTAKPTAKIAAVTGSTVVMTPPPQKARLKLSILDLVDIKDPDLKITNELSSLPTDDLGKREAAGALWRSFNKSPQDMAREDVQQRLMLEDVKALREITGKNQRDLQDLGQRLERAEAQRYANPLIYALVGVLALVVAAFIFTVRKMRSGQADMPWWRSNGASHGDDASSTGYLDLNLASSNEVSAGAVKESDTLAPTAAVPKTSSVGSPVDFRDSGLDIDLGLDDPVPPVSATLHPVERKDVVVAMKAIASGGIHRDLTHSLHASLHAINTQEMLDVRQQADFFMTLGQHEEAISLLRGSIKESASSNPLVYLDLLKVLHTLSRKPAFDHYRAEFNEIFTGRVQAYATFAQPSNTLDAYPQICTEISELWGRDGAVEFLEQCMVRRPEDAAEMYFDLDAFRDLLTLHAVASRLDLNAESDSSLMPFSAVRISPLPDLEDAGVLAGDKSLELAEATLPVQAASDVDPTEPLDLDVGRRNQNHNQNLIDFDASGLAVKPPPRGHK